MIHNRERLVDECDEDLVNSYNWYEHRVGSNVYLKGYRRGSRKDGLVYLHHLILPQRSGYEIDHINGNGFDNRRSNLRYVTRSENGHNRGGVRGYYLDSWTGKWKAEIWINGKKTTLGRFPDELSARHAYESGKRIHGLYSRECGGGSTSV